MFFVQMMVPLVTPSPRNPVLFRKPLRKSAQRVSVKRSDDETDARQTYLDNAALDFAKGLEAGLTADEIVRIQMGVEREDELSTVQQRYKEKLVTKLRERAAELKKKSEKCAEFEAGKRAYGRGAYPRSCKLFEIAATQHPEGSVLGGDIRMWLALTYQALGRTEDCVALFKRLQDTHPSKQTRQQAKDLLYIIEAPKLQIGEDERVKLPILKDLDRPPARLAYGRGRSRPKPQERRKAPSLEERFWESYRPPVAIPNRYVWAAFTAVGIGLAVFSVLHRPVM